jgi:hypothetical protein
MRFALAFSLLLIVLGIFFHPNVLLMSLPFVVVWAVLATCSSARFFGFLGRNFLRRSLFSVQGGLGLFYEYTLGSFG